MMPNSNRPLKIMREIPDLNHARQSSAGRCFHWLFTRRIMRWFLIGLAGFATFIAACYAWIDWHGAREWKKCQRDMIAHGEEWDLSAFVPAPVPDDQNIFAAPKMAEWFGDNRGLVDTPLEERRTNEFARRLYYTNSTDEITNASLAASYLAWSDQFQTEFDTIAAALQRPSARIVADYSRPFSISLPNAVSCLAVVVTLERRANCHLLLGQPDKAWQELTLLHDLRRLVECQGKFITTEGNSMRLGLIPHSLPVIARGLGLHAWQEPQLVALQNQLNQEDVLAGFTEALECARAVLFCSLANGDLSQAAFASGGDGVWHRLKQHPQLLLFWLVPRGAFFYHDGARKVVHWRNMINALRPAGGIIHPAEVSQAFAFWKRAQQGLPNLLRLQTLVNEAQIACALERYRLVHGNYPETLDPLVPQFIEKLPRDIINGQPLIYRRAADGGFLLYSVGWNETDDGGRIILPKGDPKKAALGDWVWRNSLTEF